MKHQVLYNQKSRTQLRKELAAEKFHRVGASFYRYTLIEDPQAFRDQLYLAWSNLRIFGRIYVAREGINAQFCVPEHSWNDFMDSLDRFPETQGIFVNRSNSSGDQSFIKLDVRVREKIVADGLQDNIFEYSEIGTHLGPEQFHKKMQDPNVLVVDVRNDYECETGKFENALTPESETFKEVLPELSQKLQEHKDKELLLYCTGGIRCEKASAFLKHEGYNRVYQLQGGIINYLKEIKEKKESPKYKGSIFVFDGRMAESQAEKIAECYQCGQAHDMHRDCDNTGCHKLMVQCPSCEEKFQGCCSQACMDILTSTSS
ncbi:MAG: rhodanese-related sulfurtransferase [Bdellovibrionales bacterium]|nr:rhodanese-related sulfurtransferase [Bdellovibrionales bacterium]